METDIQKLQKKVEFYKKDRDGFVDLHTSAIARENLLKLELAKMRGRNRALLLLLKKYTSK
jgi:hypothetical protein